MEASVKQQASELIKSAQSVLLVGHKNPDGDALGSILALKIVLEKMGKVVTAVTSDAPNRIFEFLPKISEIKRKIEGASDFIISLDVSKVEIAKIGYKKEDQEKKVNIVISPRESGRFTSQDVSFPQTKPKFDLIISVDTPNLERLGEIASPADIFYETPLINIDHHPSNEKFGKINLVELVATSTSEILVSLFESLSKDNQVIDAEVATCLLTGLIYDTSSFQNVNTTPKSLTIAAQLVAAGARQQEIVKNLYKTKSMETLKLWGLVLTKVQEDKVHRFLYSSISREELEKTGADESALSGVVDELLKSATDVDFAMLLSERQGFVHGSLRSIAKGVNVARIAESFGGGGHEVAAAFRLEGSLKANEQTILDKIAKLQEKGSSQDSAFVNENAPEIKAEVKKEEVVAKVDDSFETKSESVILEKVETKEDLKQDEVEPAQSEIEKIEKNDVTPPFASAPAQESKEDDSPEIDQELSLDASRAVESIVPSSEKTPDLPPVEDDKEPTERIVTKW